MHMFQRERENFLFVKSKKKIGFVFVKDMFLSTGNAVQILMA